MERDKKISIRVALGYRDQSEFIGTNREMRGGARQVDQHLVSAGVSGSIGVYRN